MKNIEKLEIEYIKVDDLIPYDKNPRKNDKAVPMVVKSIEQFGFKVPIVVDENNVIVCGHTRHKAAKKIGMTDVPCIRATDLTPEQIRAFRIADNKVAEMAEWDQDFLLEEIDALPEFDFSEFGFEEEEMKETKELDETYTQKVVRPQYEITGDKPSVGEMYDGSKTKDLIARIEKSDVPEDIKEFLRYAAYRHTVINYSRVAEFYAHSEKDVQELFEDSALVILDFEDAIDKGYVLVNDKIKTEVIDDEENEVDDIDDGDAEADDDTDE